ncbi:MAG: VPDSG-CTERM exosortase interaction domain protein [Prevotella sp.]|nr:VPDSG-CTERM exosortase interaction domain protein [Prevotella sp.]
MNKKSFFLGVVTGVILTFAVLFIIGLVNQNSADNDPVQYLEKPVSYENKKETSFKVLQVLGNAALATEASDEIGGDVMYYGNTVVILGENYYSDQIVKVKNPQRVGTYSYTNKGGMPMTVPVIDGEME